MSPVAIERRRAGADGVHMIRAPRVRTLLGAVLAAAAIAAVPVAPAAAATCSAPVLSQPFLAFGDRNFYALAPGGTFDDPSGAGWTLSAGAGIVSTTQADGTVGGVLDLPSRASAVSPVMCITSDFPKARMWVRNVNGSEGVFFFVSYLVKGTWTTPKNTGQFHGDHSAWTLTGGMNVQPSSAPGWQQVRFTFVGGGSSSRFQVNDFWVDPRLRT
jgi:hypothetical protein